MMLFSSVDNGTSWTLVDSGFTESNITGFTEDNGVIYAGTGRKVYRSTDNGTTWSESGSGLPDKIIHCLYTKGNSVFAGTGAGVFFSIART